MRRTDSTSVALHFTTTTKVREFQRVVGADHDVCGFDVQVDDVTSVYVVKSVGELQREVDATLDVQALAGVINNLQQ